LILWEVFFRQKTTKVGTLAEAESTFGVFETSQVSDVFFGASWMMFNQRFVPNVAGFFKHILN